MEGSGRIELEFNHNGEVVRRDMGMGASMNMVLFKPGGINWSKDTQHIHMQLGIEDVVYDTFEIISRTD